jgi:hypothetical protein
LAARQNKNSEGGGSWREVTVTCSTSLSTSTTMAARVQTAPQAALKTMQRFRQRVLNAHAWQTETGKAPTLAPPSPILRIADASGRGDADARPYGTPGAPLVWNPFVPHKRHGVWIPPKYSLRRQKELVKAAKATGLVELLPPGPKLRDPLAVANVMAVEALAQQRKAERATRKAERRETRRLAREEAARKVAGVSEAVDGTSSAWDTSAGVLGSEEATLESQPGWGIVSVTEEVAVIPPPPSAQQPRWDKPLRWYGAPRALKPTQVLGVRLRMYAGRRGRAFKGTAWQRSQKAREEARSKEMTKMPRRVKNYQSVLGFCFSTLGKAGLTLPFSSTAAAASAHSSPTLLSSNRSCLSELLFYVSFPILSYFVTNAAVFTWRIPSFVLEQEFEARRWTFECSASP